ncbi:hypothetical protein IRZ83_16380 [Flavobacterium sp. JLP]|uniref:hypothetical protein n=1 Tax=Flavobacterium sp. JLP TaxID=2783793 RepID=UPI00188C09F6|nr:hypothetical protein [Flavobacterium sp. JLP]MBF4508255.1 hypothetical protein [Flavobacterium sp. JLP]
MDLKNIWIVKNFHKLIYPRQILPKKNYKLLLDFDILKLQQVYLIRRSNLSYDETFFKFGNGFEINEDAIINHPKSILGLSTNIAGGPFKEKHLKFRLNMHSSGNEKWIKKKRVFLYSHLDSISLTAGCAIYMNVNKIHKYPHDCKKPYSNELVKFLSTINTPISEEVNDSGNKTIKVPGTCIIKHDPLVLNYWHAEFHLIDIPNGNEIKKYGSKWLEEYCREIITNVISRNCTPQPTLKNHKLKKDLYIE